MTRAMREKKRPSGEWKTVVQNGLIGWWVVGLALVVGAVVVGFAFFAWFEYTTQSYMNEVGTRLNAVADFRHRMVETWLRGRLECVAATSRFPSIAAVFMRHSGIETPIGPGGEGSEEHVNQILELVVKGHEFSDAYLVDADGTILHKSAPYDLNMVLKEASRLAIASRKPTFHADISQTNGAIFAFASPVFLDIEQKAHSDVIGTLVFVVGPQLSLFQAMKESKVLGLTGETILVKPEEGVLRPLSSPVLGEGHDMSTILMRNAEPVTAKGTIGLMRAVDYRGHEVLLVMKPIPDTTLWLLVKADSSELLAGLHNERRSAVAGGIGVYLAIAGIILALWRHQRSRFYEALAEQEARYFDLFEKSHDGVGIIAQDGTILLISPTALRMWGYESEQDVIGHNIDEFLAPDSRRKVATKWRNTEQASDISTIEAVAVRRDGTTFFVEARVSPIEWEGQQANLVTGRDITERKRAEASLERYHALADNSRDIILFVSPDARIVEANRAAVDAYGYTRDELIGMDGQKLRQPLTDPSVAERIAEAMKREIFYETIHRRKDGTTFPVEVTARGVTIGENQYVVAVIRDVSERKRLEQQTMAAQRLESLGRLAGGVAHDFNNLLTAIRGYAGLLMEKIPRHLASDVEEIVKAADRAAKLTQQLLAFSRKQLTELKVVDLNEVVRGIEKMLQRIIGEDVELESKSDGAPAYVNIDVSQIENLLVNLALNARDAMPRGGRLTIRTEVIGDGEKGFVRLTVRDTGCGMTDEVKARAFEPFFTTKEQGTGLGLSTAYGIVRQHGGTITLESQPGRGTTVTVELPRSKQIPGPKSEPVEEDPHGTETILLAEDDPGVRAYALRVLRERGYNVIETKGGDEALAVLEGRPGLEVQLLVTDVVMPRMSGPELRDRLITLRPGLKTLFISGYTEAITHDLANGAKDCLLLRKPFTPQALAKMVRMALDNTTACNI